MTSIVQTVPLLLGWLGCYCLARELAARKHIDSDWCLSFAMASVSWGALVTAITELSSLVQSLTAPVIWLAWIAADAGLFAVTISLARQRGVMVKEELRAGWKRARHADFSEWPWDARCCLAATVALVAFLFAVALAFATTNWDSLNYHLPRIMHWAQNETVEHFPTNNSRHLEFGPWSGFLSLMLYVLSGSDRLINLVQWCAMAGSIVLVSFVVKAIAFNTENLSAAQRHRITGFTCLLAATIPIGLVQCMNPQSDCTATFWLCCLVCFALGLIREPENRCYMLGAGLACGIGVLTKATFYVYAAPLIVGFGVWWLSRKFTWARKARLAGAFCAAFFLLNAGHMVRNYAVFGSPLSSPYIMSIERNTHVTVSGTAANIVRNLSLHSNSGIPGLTRALNKIFARAHGWTGRAFSDPEITYHIPGYFELYDRFYVFDSYAPGFYHLALVLLALVLACVRPKHFRAALWHAGWIVLSFLLFCAYLKWQYWHTRLHLAYFVLFTPVVAWVLVERLPRLAIPALAAGLLLFAGCTLVHNQSRPFLNPRFVTLPRESQLLSAHLPSMNGPIAELADTIVKLGRANVGLKLEFDAPEYPIWVMLKNRGFRGVLHHVYAENETRKLLPRYVEPDLLIVSASLGTPPSIQERYPVSAQFGRFLLLSKADWAHARMRPDTQSHR